MSSRRKSSTAFWLRCVGVWSKAVCSSPQAVSESVPRLNDKAKRAGAKPDSGRRRNEAEEKMENLVM